jgi:hypothetical protein
MSIGKVEKGKFWGESGNKTECKVLSCVEMWNFETEKHAAQGDHPEQRLCRRNTLYPTINSCKIISENCIR